jgi:hypothetical protein
MNLEEFKQAVDFAYQQCERPHQTPDEITVRIPVYRLGGAGRRPCVDVANATLGFDWDKHSFLITPAKELREIDCDEIKKLRDEYEELSWSLYKINQLKRANKELQRQLEQMQSGLLKS